MFKYLVIGLVALPVLALAEFDPSTAVPVESVTVVPPHAPQPWKEYQKKSLEQPLPGTTEQDRLDAVAAWAYRHFPFLNSASSYANNSAIDEVVAIRDQAIRAGVPPAEALAQAVEQIGPTYEAMESQQRREQLLREQKRLVEVIKLGEAKKRANEAQDISKLRSASPAVTGINKPDNIIIDTRSGQRMDNAAGGFVDPRTGTFYQRVAGGYVETTTGRFIPAP